MATEAKKLKSLDIKRKGFIKQLENFEQFLNTIENNSESTQHISDRIELIINKFENFDQTQSAIEELMSDDNLVQDEFCTRSEIESNYCKLLSKGRSIIKHNSVSQQTSVTKSNNIHLPSIHLPTFDGDYTKWKSFHDAFNSLIHNNTELPKVQKLCYLRSALRGEALALIQSIEITSDNYEIAHDLLQSRFSNNRKIIYSHIYSVLNAKPSNLRELANTFDQHLRCLGSLNTPIEHWDAIIVPIMLSKLEPRIARDWEMHVNSTLEPNDIPKYRDLHKFLICRSESFDSMKPIGNNNQTNKFKSRSFPTTTENFVPCPDCKENHLLFKCNQFLSKDIPSRITLVKEAKLCLNCFKKGHFVNECKSSKCKQCHKNHNTLLHIESSHNLNRTTISNNDQQTTTLAHCSQEISLYTYSLLPTAEVLIIDKLGNSHVIRALLDSASQSHFVTERVCKLIQAEKHNSTISVTGINQGLTHVKYCTSIAIHSKVKSYSKLLSFLVLPKITENIPQFSFKAEKLNIPTNFKLADETFNNCKSIDMLLGAPIFWELMETNQFMIKKPKLILQDTKLGWVVSGTIPLSQNQNISKSFSCQTLNNQIEKFWEVEDFKENKPLYTKDQIECEEIFKQTTIRDNSGRFVVKLPLKLNRDILGDSREIAIKRFLSLEKRLQRAPDIKSMYTTFLREYQQLGHMTKISESNKSKVTYFLPHHHVLRETSLTSKLRVVFDGSTKSTSGYSLNDIQHIGPTIQSDLFSILIKFRKHAFVAIADIEKMYRQILVDPSDRPLQQIVWRENPSDKLEIYQLNTVTYGTASAPFLAIRCLHELANQNKHVYPTETNIMKNDIYVDDLITGCDKVDELQGICNNITKICSAAGLNLRKWISNTQLLNSPYIQLEDTCLNLHKNETKTLGINYKPINDVLFYSFSNNLKLQKITKRCILSGTSQIFDPLGLLTPITIVPKLLIQYLWKIHIDWDKQVPLEVQSKWTNFETNLQKLATLTIPRYILSESYCHLELHGFSDASEKAYGACIYIKSMTSTGQLYINLVTAKSRVAPLKTITLPRLELCAASLLAELVDKVCKILNLSFARKFYWCDSSIVLAWITGESQWKTFVANRIAEIRRLTEISDWYHVKSEDNPADLISRGVQPQLLQDLSIWWYGPKWLQSTEYPNLDCKPKFLIHEIPEQKSNVISLKTHVEFDIVLKYSNINKLITVMAYCLRFIHNCQSQKKISGIIQQSERNSALLSLIKCSQYQTFKTEIDALKQTNLLHSSSKLLSLSPFLDNDGLLRVGGRLINSELDYNMKHQIILPNHHQLTTLIASNEHLVQMHCGPQQLLYMLRQKYWPIAGKSLTRRIVHNCLKCYRQKPQPYTQIIGNLPNSRITPSPPFYNSGVDYAGPFLTRDRRARGYKTYKSYICLFICFSTKAVHIELVSDLSTESFLAALRRFVSRRGKPKTIHSDNGTNFVGANNELKRLHNLINENINLMCNQLSEEGKSIEWKFIPPRSPHFGGLWESNIKIIKLHLTKVIGQTILTFEEFNTVLCQIEAVVNSRPLSLLSSDPHDLTPLTPSHFLIGRPLTSIDEEEFTSTPTTRLSRFQQMQQLTQHFWNRWNIEYLHQLQIRSKWHQARGRTPQEGDIVLIMDNNTPPGSWKMGRITKLWPGSDRQVRVVSVRVNNNIIKRSVTKLCPVPIEQ